MAGPAEFVHGKMFIGLILNVLLTGINITQTYLYYIYSKKDRLWIKIWVVIVLVADLLQPLFCLLYLYRALVVKFGNVDYLSTATNLFAIVPTMSGITATIVQLFFAWRIRVLTNNWYCAAVVVAAAISGPGVLSILIAYQGTQSPQFTEFRNFKILVITRFVLGGLADIMIVSIMVWFLMVERIIRVTVQTGLITLIFAVLEMVYFVVSPNGTYLVFDLVSSKLYTSSFLSSLNSRKGWGYDTSEDRSTMSTLKFSSKLNVGRTSGLDVTTTPEDSIGSIEAGLQQQRRESTDNGGVELESEVRYGPSSTSV